MLNHLAGLSPLRRAPLAKLVEGSRVGKVLPAVEHDGLARQPVAARSQQKGCKIAQFVERAVTPHWVGLLDALAGDFAWGQSLAPVSYTHLRAHETRHDIVCRL